MNLLIMAAFLIVATSQAAANQPPGGVGQDDAGQPFRVEPDDFRWMPLNVRRAPSEVDCRFEVIQGGPSIHVELLPMSEFRLFSRSRGRDHDTMALTPNGRSGEFRRIVDVRGQYAVVVENDRGARPATVLLHLRTSISPDADIARTLSPARRLTVILISFAFFFATVSWSGRKLVRAMRS